MRVPGLWVASLLWLPASLLALLRLDEGDRDGNGVDATFRLGHFCMHSGRYSVQDVTSVLRTCFAFDSPDGASAAHHRAREMNQVLRHLLSAWGMTLPGAASFAIRNTSLERLSHEVNTCSSSGVLNEVGKEILFHAALSVWPWNVYASKNLAWTLEWEGSTRIARSLYKQTFQITGDIGCLFHCAFVSPPLLWSPAHGLSAHLQILAEAHSLISSVNWEGKHFDPGLILREFQIAWQYTGVAPGVVSEIYSRVLLHLFPYLAFADPFVKRRRSSAARSSLAVARITSPPPIRLGVITEHEANSSPGLCMMDIFLKLSLLTHRDELDNEVPDFHIVYFRRPDSATTFNERMEAVAHETLTLAPEPGFHEISREIIVAQRLDILLFMALPTEKFTILLSQARLATTQIHFGVGHPVTSGSSAMDYTVVARDMLLTDKSVTHSPRTNVTECMQWASSCQQEIRRQQAGQVQKQHSCELMRRHGCTTEASGVEGETAPLLYTEQVVLFDSLGHYIGDPLTYYAETRDFDPVAFAYDASCRFVDSKLQQWRLFPNITAAMLGCREDGSSTLRNTRDSHLYTCIQNPKKMHPSFDPVLGGIIRRDPKAKILVDYRIPCLIPRWRASWNLTEEEILERFVFVPRLEHRQYLQLVSLSSVFLNTFPFGAGVTSSEAIALGVPVVVYAETSSVINLAMAQVRALGEPWTRDLIVSGLEAYVDRAVQITRLEQVDDGLRRYRQELRRRSQKLHGPAPLAAAAAEWALFLKRVA